MVSKSAVCDHVINGDTFRTTKHQIIRLDNVCTPEDDSPDFSKAKETLEGLILNKAIVYDQTDTSFDRIVAEVFVNGINVNHYMRLEGYTCPKYWI